MKKTIFSVLILLPFMAAAQKNYTITGKLPAVKGQAKAYLVLLKNNAWKETDSAEIKDGKFQFTGSVNEPQNAILAVRRNGAADSGRQRDALGFFIENSKIEIVGTDLISNAKITGSVANRENEEREAMIKPVTAKIIKLQDEFGKKAADGSYIKSLEERKKAGDSIQKLVAMNKDINHRFAETHLNSFMGLYTFNMYVLDNKFDPAKEEPLFNRFSTVLKSSPLGKRTIEKLEIGKRRQTGAKATDFTQNDLNGKPFTLSSLRGKYVLVDFWASWCGPCRAENPNVVKAYNELKGKNFEIVGVSLDYPGGKAAWAEAVKKDGLPWIQVSDLKGWKNEVALMYGINSVPQNLLIDPQGVIIAKNLRGEALTDKLKELIK
ncbi:TlpA disulfide reductase family protein [Pedobacter heparinus]|uniref:Alkyl hydroperoxide reductase/ Thiol specific antioxidant/ Mal allergen n=1 Tax=Pedobacter heparinus (strain ATCC 13125 / DSM 2366 / CIP 104194 / JCM 7457 / NBRC 12017 / NCIMB 9290 / NRRL B-14731 / HIM 762-3) TaxID=485917 RepID=C6XVV9_PEDHD|nr:TlpA disulfide reductase family protein [Pedobacter heparinus]ACU06184.1 alkyl hydroperoxide reductase/ Thiol specific antioxidant/ Mal allergen [Pedobacter heparinus DSM 2366]